MPTVCFQKSDNFNVKAALNIKVVSFLKKTRCIIAYTSLTTQADSSALLMLVLLAVCKNIVT